MPKNRIVQMSETDMLALTLLTAFRIFNWAIFDVDINVPPPVAMMGTIIKLSLVLPLIVSLLKHIQIFLLSPKKVLKSSPKIKIQCSSNKIISNRSSFFNPSNKNDSVCFDDGVLKIIQQINSNSFKAEQKFALQVQDKYILYNINWNIGEGNVYELAKQADSIWTKIKLLLGKSPPPFGKKSISQCLLPFSQVL